MENYSQCNCYYGTLFGFAIGLALSVLLTCVFLLCPYCQRYRNRLFVAVHVDFDGDDAMILGFPMGQSVQSTQA